MFFAFEESADEICRNARSVGLDLQRWVDAGLLRFEASRPSLFGLEMHLGQPADDETRLIFEGPAAARAVFCRDEIDMGSVLQELFEQVAQEQTPPHSASISPFFT